MEFLDALRSRVLVFDGAMGTLLYEKGISLSHCFDALNLKEPDLVRDVHRAYRGAGAMVLETNTFGANRFRLAADNRAEQVAEINAAGVRLARDVAGDDLLVAGSIGPLGKHMEPIGTIPPADAAAAYAEQGRALVEAGADLLILETISDLEEMVVAHAAVKDLGVPVVALMTILEEAKTVQGEAVKIKVKKDKVMINGAQVVKADIVADNGVIHVIDSVILPPEGDDSAE